MFLISFFIEEKIHIPEIETKTITPEILKKTIENLKKICTIEKIFLPTTKDFWKEKI